MRLLRTLLAASLLFTLPALAQIPAPAGKPTAAEAQAFMAVARAVAGRVSVANGARAPAAAVPAVS